MDTSLDPKPFFPRLLGLPFKRTVIKKPTTPTSAYLADIARDSSPCPLPKAKPQKRKNTFLKAFSKVVPCVSGKGHQFDEGDVPASGDVVDGEASPSKSLRGLGIQDPQRNTTPNAFTPAQVAELMHGGRHTLTPSIASSSKESLPAFLNPLQKRLNNDGRSSSPKIEIPPTPPSKSPSPPPSIALDSPPPSSLSSVPLSILGEDPADHSEVADETVGEDAPAESMRELLVTLLGVLKKMDAVAQQHPSSIEFVRLFPAIPKLYQSVFFPGHGDDEGFEHGFEVGNESEDVNPNQDEETYQDADITFDESAWPTGSDENIPKLMLSLPTEPDLTLAEGETTMVDEDARPISPELLSTQWHPTPHAVKRWRARAAAKKRSDFKLRKATSVPDLSPIRSFFDMDVDDENDDGDGDEQASTRALSSDQMYFNSVVSRIASESKRGLGIVPDGFLPSRDALAARLRKVPAHDVSVQTETEGSSIDSAPSPTPLASINEDEECKSILSPALAPENDDASAYESVPSSPLVGHLSAWTFMASRRLSITQAGEPVVAQQPLAIPQPVAVSQPVTIQQPLEIPAFKPRSTQPLEIPPFKPRSTQPLEIPPFKPRQSSTASIHQPLGSPIGLSARRMSRRSAHYTRLDTVWKEKVLSQSSPSSRGHSTRFTGIRPLILPTRVARRESSEHGSPSEASRRASVVASDESEQAGASAVGPTDSNSFNVAAAPEPVSSQAVAAVASTSVTPPPPTPRYEYF